MLVGGNTGVRLLLVARCEPLLVSLAWQCFGSFGVAILQKVASLPDVAVFLPRETSLADLLSALVKAVLPDITD